MSVIDTSDDLRTTYAEPGEAASKKLMPRLDGHARAFIALSPFLVVASRGPGGADCSPRGDGPGFVRVVDDNTVLIPDRKGNNLLDTLGNVVADPEVGLLFFVPGVAETLRANGTARIVTDPALLEPMAVRGQVPASAMEVTIRQVYFHCGRALIRAKLWDPDTQIEKGGFPSLGRIIADQVAGIDADEADKRLEEAYTTRLY
ncbi:MAG: pyridoxamine 5'-phosphate oxidase family protein [Thalassobaculum sp.]|uniref:pyridoxamine 5'-phosphate oxidase family protein n=1 Tax=Thalassobaculum sp. TaxID=2022740 RepID=UPI0032EE05E9